MAKKVKRDKLGFLEVPPKFKILYTTQKPIILVTGGRAGTKSFNVALFISRLLFERGHVVLYARYTMSADADSVIPEFQKKLELDGTYDYFTQNKSEVKNDFSDSVVKFRGIKTSSGNQTAKLKGIEGLTTFVGDELEEWRNSDDYDTLSFSIRSENADNREILVMNPSDVDHFIYDYYIKDTHRLEVIDGVEVQISTDPRVEHIHTSYLDGLEYLSGKFLGNIKLLRDKHYREIAKDPTQRNHTKYARKIIGRWADRREGTIINNYRRGEWDNTVPYLYGLDYGFFPDPLALIKVGLDTRNKILYVQKMLYSTKLSDESILSYLQSNVSMNDLIVADTNEPKTTDKIRIAGFNIQKAGKGSGSVGQDARSFEDYEIVICGDEPEIIENEFKNWTWNDKKASIPMDGQDDHAIAAIRYGKRKLETPGVSASFR